MNKQFYIPIVLTLVLFNCSLKNGSPLMQVKGEGKFSMNRNSTQTSQLWILSKELNNGQDSFVEINCSQEGAVRVIACSASISENIVSGFWTVNGEENRIAGSENQITFRWDNLKSGVYNIQAIAMNTRGEQVKSNIEFMTVTDFTVEKRIEFYKGPSEIKLESVDGSLEVANEGCDQGFCVKSKTDQDYQNSGIIRLNKQTKTSRMEYLDEFRVRIRINKNPTYLTIRFNDDWDASIQIYFSKDTPINKWFTYYYSIPRKLLDKIKDDISSVSLIHENPGEILIADLEFDQTDGGSFKPTGRPLILAGRPQVSTNSVFRRDISKLPILASKNRSWLKNLGGHLHPDFGSEEEHDTLIYGIPFNIDDTVAAPKIKFQPFSLETPLAAFQMYYEESDFLEMGYPYRNSYKIEFGSDKHLLVVDPNNGDLYEQWNSFPEESVPESPDYPGQPANPFVVDGTFWNLNSNGCRTPSVTSADAAGLPIYPLLLTYEDVASGDLQHMLRFTKESVSGVIWPASHKTGGTDRSLTGFHSDAYRGDSMPFGTILRLKSNFDVSRFSLINQRILRGLKKYGMILADNGGTGFISGTPDHRWNSIELDELKSIVISESFEVVDVRNVIVRPTTYAVKPLK